MGGKPERDDDKPPPPLPRVSRAVWRKFHAREIRSAHTPAIAWNGRGFVPAWVTGWCWHDGEWFVRLRIRHDVFHDREDWYAYTRARIVPLGLDERDRKDWLRARPEAY